MTLLPIYIAFVISGSNKTFYFFGIIKVPNFDKLSSLKKPFYLILYFINEWHLDTEISQTLTSLSCPLPILKS
jgi:hypothetical protein